MKAQGMSIGVVITAALAVMVLLMVGGFMSGGFSALTGKITGFVGSGPSAEETGQAAGCSAACTAWKAANCPDGGGTFNQVKKSCGEKNAAGTWQDATLAEVDNKLKIQVTVDGNEKVKCECKAGGAWGA